MNESVFVHESRASAQVREFLDLGNGEAGLGSLNLQWARKERERCNVSHQPVKKEGSKGS